MFYPKKLLDSPIVYKYFMLFINREIFVDVYLQNNKRFHFLFQAEIQLVNLKKNKSLPITFSHMIMSANDLTKVVYPEWYQYEPIIAV